MSTNFEDDERFDGLYLNVAQTTKGIEPLLDTVFGFLRRKTDFFAGPPGSEGEAGMEAAMEKVQQVLSKHAQRYQSSKKKSSGTSAKPTPKPAPKKKAEPPKKKEEEAVIEMGNDGGFDVSAAPETKAPASTPPPAVPAAPASKSAKPEGDTTPDKDETKAPPPVGNGGTVPGKYVWTQTLAEVTLTIPVPDNTRGKDVAVTMTRSKLQAGLRGASTPKIVDGELCKAIIVDDSFWTIEDGNRLVLQLQKSNTMEWWDCIVKGDPGIDVKTIQPENSSLGDLDGETRKTVGTRFQCDCVVLQRP